MQHAGCMKFVPDLASAGKNYKEIKAQVNAAYGDQSYQKTIVNAIVKKIKAGKSPADMQLLILKKIRTSTIIASVTATH